MQVRRATINDINSLFDIYNNDGIKHSRTLDSYPLMNMLMDENNIFLIALNPKPVGFIHVRTKGEDAKIDFFSVLSIDKNKVQEKLLDAAEKEISANKITIYLPKSDQEAINLFTRKGYRIFDEISDLFGEGNNGVYLVRNLTDIPKQKKVKKKRAPTKPRIFHKNILIENLKKLEELSTV